MSLFDNFGGIQPYALKTQNMAKGDERGSKRKGERIVDRWQIVDISYLDVVSVNIKLQIIKSYTYIHTHTYTHTYTQTHTHTQKVALYAATLCGYGKMEKINRLINPR